MENTLGRFRRSALNPIKAVKWKPDEKTGCHLNYTRKHILHKLKNSVSIEPCLLELRRIHYHPYLLKAAAQCEVEREKREKWCKHKRSEIIQF